MRIQHLRAGGLKSGKTPIDHRLNKLTVFCGHNFSGKTRRLDAIRIGLGGYLPELGKQAASTMGLATGDTLGTALTFDGGETATRTWTRSSKGMVKCVQTGPALEVPPVLMDPNEYFRLGDKDRVRYVFGLSTVEAPEETVNAIVAKTKMLRFEPGTPAHEAVIAELVDQIMESNRKRHDEEQPVQDWIEALIAEQRDALKLAKQSADRMVKTVQGITQIKAVEDDGVLRDCAQKITDCEQEISKRTSAMATMTARLESIKKAQADKEMIETRLAQAGDRTEEAERLRRSIAAEETALEELRARVPVAVPSEAVTRQQAEVAELERVLAELEGAWVSPDLPPVRPGSWTGKLLEDRSAALSRWHLATERATVAAGELEAARASKDRHLHLKECPFCGHSGSSWKVEVEAKDEAEIDRTLKAKNKANQQVAEMKAAAELAEVRLKDEQGKDAEHSIAITHQADARRRHQTRISEQRRATQLAREGLNGSMDRDRENHAAAVREHASEHLKKSQDIAAKRKALAVIEEAAKTTAADRTRLADLAGVDYVPAIADLQTDIASEWTAVQAAQQRRGDLQERQRVFLADQQDARRQAQARLEADQATGRVEVLGAFLKLLEDLQVAMVEQAFRPLIEAANRITSGILPSPLAYHDGELGRWHGSTWIGHQTFSGTEQALAYAGLSVALAKDSPIRIVLLDEMGRMEAANARLVVERLLSMIEAGWIDQAVLADVDASRYRDLEAGNKGLSVICI